MERKVVDVFWDRINLININENFKFLFEYVNNTKSAISKEIWEELKEENTVSMLKPVATFNDLPKTAPEKSLVSVTDEQRIYAFVNGDWIEFTTFELDPFSGYKKELQTMIDNQNNEQDYKVFAEDNKKTTSKNTLKVLGDRDIKVDLYQNDKEFYTLNFGKNAKDDFIKFRNVLYNFSEKQETSQETVLKNIDPNSIKNGVVKGSGNNYYTSTVGATYTYTFTGTDIWLRAFVDDRGGLWKATVDGGTPKNISVNINAQTDKELLGGNHAEKLIASNLENKQHTLILEYVGQDPKYPNSDNRGWFKVDSDDNQYNYTFKINTITGGQVITKSQEVIADSNKEFAFSVEVNGITHWVPMHNSVGTLFLSDKGSQKLYVDGIEKSLSNTSNYNFEVVTIAQDLYGYHPELINPICQITIVATIDKNGVKFDIKTTWLQIVKVSAGYVGMQTINPTIINTLVSSYGEKYPLNLFDGTYQNLDEKSPYGFIGLSDTKDIYVTAQAINGYEAYRMTASDRYGDEYGSGLIGLQYRDKTLHKLYPRVFDRHATKEGETYKFSLHYGFGQLPFVNKLF